MPFAKFIVSLSCASLSLGSFRQLLQRSHLASEYAVRWVIRKSYTGFQRRATDVLNWLGDGSNTTFEIKSFYCRQWHHLVSNVVLLRCLSRI